MAGRTGIVKGKERKEVLDKDYLYGEWAKDMEKGVDEAQAAGAAALTQKPKYKGWKSDLAWLAAQKKKKAAAKAAREKKAKYDPNRDKTKKKSREGGNDPTGYAVVEGGSPEMESYATPKKEKKRKKTRRVLGRVAR